MRCGVKEAVLYAPEQDRALLASGGRFERIAAAIRGEKDVTLTLAGEPIRAAGGIVAASGDGHVSYHKTFDEIA